METLLLLHVLYLPWILGISGVVRHYECAVCLFFPEDSTS